MTDPSVVTRKLVALNDHLNRLRSRRPDDLAIFRADSLLQDGVALSILVVVQEAVDIALHIASDEGWGVPSSFRESFELLARHGVIDEALASRLGDAASLRNRIAHGYAGVDVDRLWAEIPAGVTTFERFSSAVASWLARA